MRLKNLLSERWKSRKVWFGVFAVLALLVGLKLTADSVIVAGNYPSFVGGVTGVTGLVIAGNVGAKLVTKKKDGEESPSE